MSKKNKIKDFTVRMWRKDKKKVTAKEARAALWVAYKLAKNGENLDVALRDWHIEAINWRNQDEKVFTYGSDRAAEILVALGPILNSLDWNNDLRAEVPDTP